MRRALRRAASSRRLFVLAALLLAVMPAGGTWAFFSADTTSSTSQFTGGWVGEASSGTITASGYDASLSWAKATHVDTVTGETLTYIDRNTTSNCTGATYSTSIGSVGTGTTYTTSGFTSTLNGHYVCFKLVTADNNWNSQGYLFGVAHLGLFPITTVIANGGTAARADAADTITITFNQNVATGSVPANNSTIDVCFVSNTVIIGDANSCTNSADAFTVAKLTGLTFTTGFNADTSTFTISGATLTIRLGTTGSGSNSHSSNVTVAGATTAATTVKSAVLTDQAIACTASANGCTPAPTGSF